MMCCINILNYVTLILIKTSDFRLHVYDNFFLFQKSKGKQYIHVFVPHS